MSSYTGFRYRTTVNLILYNSVLKCLHFYLKQSLQVCGPFCLSVYVCHFATRGIWKPADVTCILIMTHLTHYDLYDSYGSYYSPWLVWLTVTHMTYYDSYNLYNSLWLMWLTRTHMTHYNSYDSLGLIWLTDICTYYDIIICIV